MQINLPALAARFPILDGLNRARQALDLARSSDTVTLGEVARLKRALRAEVAKARQADKRRAKRKAQRKARAVTRRCAN